MGIVVVAEDWSRKISLVSPMPVPEYNVLAAIQSVIAGKTSSIAINTIARSAGKVINLVANKMPEFRSLIQTAIEAHKTGDADKNKVVYSRLTDLLIQIELTMVGSIWHIFNIIRLEKNHLFFFKHGKIRHMN